MKMSDKELDALRVASSMPSYQTYGRNTVLELLGHIDAQEKEIEAIKAAADRLQDNVVQLRKELKVAQEEMMAAVRRESEFRIRLEELESRHKPVVLPREVVSEIEAIKRGRQASTGWKFMVLKGILHGDARTLNISRKTGVDQLLHALVNGYTVEETDEERIKARLVAELIESGIDCPIPVEHYAHQLTLAVREVMAEHPQQAN